MTRGYIEYIYQRQLFLRQKNIPYNILLNDIFYNNLSETLWLKPTLGKSPDIEPVDSL